MAYVKEIKLRVELLQNLGEYTSVKPCYEMTAALEENDDEIVVMEELEQQLYDRVQGAVDSERQKRGLSPIYSKPDYFICHMMLPPQAGSGPNKKALVLGYAEDWPKLLAWVDEFKSVTGNSMWISTFPTFWLDPYGQKRFNEMLLERFVPNENIVPISLVAPLDSRFNPLGELLEKYRPTLAEATPEQPAVDRLGLSNGYEEMEAIQQKSDPDFFDNEIEQLEDPDDPNDPFYFPDPERDPYDPQWHSDSADETIF